MKARQRGQDLRTARSDPGSKDEPAAKGRGIFVESVTGIEGGQLDKHSARLMQVYRLKPVSVNGTGMLGAQIVSLQSSLR